MNPNVKARLLYTTAVNSRLAMNKYYKCKTQKSLCLTGSVAGTRSLQRFCTIAAIAASMCGINRYKYSF